jgi:hypothetical protein
MATRCTPIGGLEIAELRATAPVLHTHPLESIHLGNPADNHGMPFATRARHPSILHGPRHLKPAQRTRIVAAGAAGGAMKSPL